MWKFKVNMLLINHFIIKNNFMVWSPGAVWYFSSLFFLCSLNRPYDITCHLFTIGFSFPPPQKKVANFPDAFFSWDLPNFTHWETPLLICIPNITPRSGFVKIHHDLQQWPWISNFNSKCSTSSLSSVNHKYG